MRVFVAIAVGPSAREGARRLRERARVAHREVERALRWVDPDHMHLTLHFLGELDEPVVERLVEVCGPPMEQSAFSYGLAAFSWFPAKQRPRVLVREVDEGRPVVEALSQVLENRLRQAHPAYQAEARPFRPHVTLARVRDGQDRLIRAAPATWWDAPGAGDRDVTLVDRVSLFESQLTPRGPIYRELTAAQLVGVVPP